MRTSEQQTENLALILQEILTATVRLRANRQNVTDVEGFRTQMRAALQAAQQEARQKGYADNDFRLAAFAVVAFIDESVLNSGNPVFALWPRKPLQEELFGGHVAGEAFFENVAGLLRTADADNVADVLEVYDLCLLLGYQGRYGATNSGELQNLKRTIAEKMQRIRRTAPLAPNWAPVANSAPVARGDAAARKLGYAGLTCFVAAILLFVVFKISLEHSVSTAQQLAVIGIGSGQ